MDLNVSTEDSPEDESLPKSRRLRARKAASSCSSDAPQPKKKKVDENENLNVEEIYEQLSSVKAKCTSLETIYECPKNSKDPAKSLMSSVKSRRSCLLSDFYNPTKSKVKARKERAKRLKRRGVKVPTGAGVTLEQLQAVLGSISEDEENEQVPNTSLNVNRIVNTGVNTYTPKKVVLRPDREREDVPLVEGPYILPDLSYQSETPAPPPMTEEELYEKTKFIFEDPSDENVRPTKRKGRRSGCGRDLLPTSLLSSLSKQQRSPGSMALPSDINMPSTSIVTTIVEESSGEQEALKPLPCEDGDKGTRGECVLSSLESDGIVPQNVGEKLIGEITETPSQKDDVQSTSRNFNSACSMVNNNNIYVSNKIFSSRKKINNSSDSCLADLSKKRSKRRVSGVEKALYSTYSTHSPVISEADDEESSSNKLDESLNDSLRTGFETKLDLNKSTSDDNLSKSANRGTLKRKSESDCVSPLAARLRTLAVKDVSSSLGSGAAGETDFLEESAQRKMIQARRRSTRLRATAAPSVSDDVECPTVHIGEKNELSCQNDPVVNCVTVERGESVTKTSELAQSELSDFCSISKHKVTTSKARKQSSKCTSGKNICSDELDKGKSLSKRAKDSRYIHNDIVSASNHRSSGNSTVEEKLSKGNTTNTLQETSEKSIESFNHSQKPSSSSTTQSSGLGSKGKHGKMKTSAVEVLSRGSKLVATRRGRRSISHLSDGLNALSVSSQNHKTGASSENMPQASVDGLAINIEQAHSSSAALHDLPKGALKDIPMENSVATRPGDSHISVNARVRSNLDMLPKGEITETESIPVCDSKTKDCPRSSNMRRFCGSSSLNQVAKEAVDAIPHVPAKQGVKRSCTTSGSDARGLELLGSHLKERIDDERPGSQEKTLSHESASKSSSNNSRCLKRSSLKETTFVVGLSPVKLTKKPKVMLNNLHKDYLFNLPSPSTDGKTTKLLRDTPASDMESSDDTQAALTNSSKLSTNSKNELKPCLATSSVDGKPSTNYLVTSEEMPAFELQSSNDTQAALTNSSKPSTNSGSEQRPSLTASSGDGKTSTDHLVTSTTPHHTPRASATALSSGMLELNADSPLVSAMFNSAVGVRVGKVFSNNRLDKSDKMSSRRIIDKFKVCQF